MAERKSKPVTLWIVERQAGSMQRWCPHQLFMSRWQAIQVAKILNGLPSPNGHYRATRYIANRDAVLNGVGIDG